MTNLELRLQRSFYPRVRRPGRYSGGELNAVLPETDDFRVVLAFPDLYEIGFPYLGFQILYHLLNSVKGVSCQRVYAPAEDAELILREEDIPLFSLEEKLPLSEAGLIGFTLQYELHASNILNMLELGKIPLHAEARAESDPIIVAGGPIAYNPEPFAPFFDAFLIGDAEESFPALVKQIRDYRINDLPREEILRRVSSMPGVYVPLLYRVETVEGKIFPVLKRKSEDAPEQVEANHISSLSPALYPANPLVPLISVEHDRLTVEIMRGCSRGCRFCNAGLLHRPTRELSSDDVLLLIARGLKATGYEELSLLSLSTADYSGLYKVLDGINRQLDDPGISLSYPSLRPDAFTPAMAASISSGRKTSLTFAPEAGSERLRSVINKDIRDEELFSALKIAREHGWRSVKLYFMVGLPDETDDDLHSLIKLARKAADVMNPPRKKHLHVSLAVFSPKPNTPFQIAGMPPLDEIRRRIRLVRDGLHDRRFKVSWHDPEMTLVETAVGRGDRRLSEVIERVFRDGARMEGWSDEFDFGRWDRAMQKCGLKWHDFTGEISDAGNLPFTHIRSGMDDEFLQQEWRKASEFTMSPDCRVKCLQCGRECPPPPKTRIIETPIIPPQPKSDLAAQTRYRCKFTRSGAASRISHRETMTLAERILRRAGAPLAYSQGFHPHPKISFGPPLPLGYLSSGDYFDVYLTKDFSGLQERLASAEAGGLQIVETVEITLKSPNLNASIIDMGYFIDYYELKPALADLRESFNQGGSVIVDRGDKGDWDITGFIKKFTVEEHRCSVLFAVEQGISPRPDLLMTAAGYRPEELKSITRICILEEDI